MKKTNVATSNPMAKHSNAVIEALPLASEIYASLPYVKFLPEATPEIHQEFLQASGEIEYRPTNNYMFQALFQENIEALTNLVCSVLHWPRESVKSIKITNPITLGKYIENKTFILDIKIIMNDDTVVNLEMQLNNYNNWPERSLGYLCRNFDNLNKGNNYTTVKSAIHIGFLDFTLFPNLPEFHATYKIQNIKNHNIYTDKFILHVIELNSINLATKEDRDYNIDKWASFFKAKTWEDIHMLVKDNPTLQSAAETLYQLNMNDQLRETCERFVYAEAEKNALNEMNTELKQLNAELKQTHDELTKNNAELEQSNAELEQSNAELEQSNAELEQSNAELEQSNAELEKNNSELEKVLADKDAEIASLKARLALHDTSDK